MQSLQDKIAVVSGASRGAGRGIAIELGAAGATVYVTGRSTRGGAKTGNRPETIEETAELVTAAGGTAIVVRCDHTNNDEVAALFERIKAEQGRLDVLVNNAWGGYEGYDGANFAAPFWEQPLSRLDAMLTAGLRSHFVTTYFATPLMLSRRQGLIVNTTVFMPRSLDFDKYYGPVAYDMVKNAINRMSFGMAHELREHGVAIVALAPGWMRTEAVLGEFKLTEANWQQNEELATTESPRYVGRGVVALASDPAIMDKTGQLLVSGDLAREYNFTDIDGRYVPRFHIYQE